MRYLVLGGTRFIGLHTVKKLVELGHEVTVFHRGDTESEGLPDVRHIHGDRADFSEHKPEFEKLEINAVIDMMPLTKADADSVVAMMQGVAPWIIGISSQDVYAQYGIFNGTEPGEVDNTPVAEAAPLRTVMYPHRDRFPDDPRYRDYDKIPVEQTYLSRFDMYGTVLRLPFVYGPHDYQHRMWPYLKRMLDDRPAILLSRTQAEWRWTRGYVENIADAIALAGTRKKAIGKIFNLGAPNALTEKEWVETIGRAVGWAGEVRVVEDDALPQHLRIEGNFEQSIVTDTGRIRTELGYEETVGLEDAIERTVAWERDNPDERLGNEAFDYAAEDAAL